MLDNKDVFIEHFGAKGMKWGVRKAKEQRASGKQFAKDNRQRKLAAKLTGGEIVVSALVGGPVGVLAYKAIKTRSANTKFKNRHLSDEEQRNAARKIGVGEALAVTLLTSPIGLITYGVAKEVAAYETEAI